MPSMLARLTMEKLAAARSGLGEIGRLIAGTI
jgi:hypothetical protein